MRARQKRYEQSEKGRQCHRRYEMSDKGRTVHQASAERFREKHGIPEHFYYRYGLHVVSRALASPVEHIDGGTF